MQRMVRCSGWRADCAGRAARVPPEEGRMGPLRNAYLDALGIDRWVSRGAPAQASPLIGAASELAEISLPAPLGDWGALRERVAGCTACAELCRSRTQTVFGVGNTRAE